MRRGGKGREGKMRRDGKGSYRWISKMLLDSVLQREIMDLIEKKRRDEE